MKNWIKSAVTGMILERPAQKYTITELADRLESSGQTIVERMTALGDGEQTRQQLRHIIGIERWGQSRLRVVLGAPLADDEYDSYQPAADLDWEALLAEFQAARADTIALAHEIAQANVDVSVTVPHNQYGKLTAHAWLRYLEIHANLESKRIT